MNLGASRLGAHVALLSKSKTGFTPIGSFDLQVKGGALLPLLGPLGLQFTRPGSHARLSPWMPRSWRIELCRN
jgi:hypothetical protein